MSFLDSTGHYWELGDVGGQMSLADLKSDAVDLQNEPDGVEVRLSNGLKYRWVESSTLASDDLLVVEPAQKQGRFVLAPGTDFNLALPISYADADAAALLTLPPGCQLWVDRSYWEVTTSFTGGTSSAIGISSDTAPNNTKGDILGGASGDVAATLAAGDPTIGTIGAKIAAGILLLGGQKVRFDRIASAFTAGAGYAHIVGKVLNNTGA